MSMNESDCTVQRDGFPRPFPGTPNNVLEQFKMTGKVVVVTGGADGIGYAVAEGMAEANAHVVLWYNSNDVAIQRAQDLGTKHNVKTASYKVDVSDAESVQKTVKKVVEDFGRIDVFVANAGMAISKPILEQTLPEFEKQMSVNGTSTPSVIPLSSHLILPSQRRGLLLQIRRRGLQATR
ncbi:hypothetical protein FVER14953_21503 [Fusarium verticillioides]|nr:hypothetical protein FVER14953_21503 [Fusarium verticillioides]